MDKNQQPKGYIQKLEEFGSAVREQGYDSMGCDGPADFVKIFTGRIGRITGITTAVAERDAARTLARTQDVTSQDYRDLVEPYESACFDAQESAATSIEVMNRYFGIMGLEPFADIDTKDPSAVQKVAGDIVVECAEGKPAGQKEDTFYKAVSQEKSQPGEAMRRLNGILAQQDGQPVQPEHSAAPEVV